jgi:hypothetical protein
LHSYRHRVARQKPDQNAGHTIRQNIRPIRRPARHDVQQHLKSIRHVDIESLWKTPVQVASRPEYAGQTGEEASNRAIPRHEFERALKVLARELESAAHHPARGEFRKAKRCAGMARRKTRIRMEA